MLEISWVLPTPSGKGKPVSMKALSFEFKDDKVIIDFGGGKCIHSFGYLNGKKISLSNDNPYGYVLQEQGYGQEEQPRSDG